MKWQLAERQEYTAAMRNRHYFKVALLLLLSFCLSGLSTPSSARAAEFLVCIDPGHPSETSDGANAHGLSENRLNWQVALRLKKRLDRLGIKSVLTKQSEKQRVTNRRRAEIANGANAYRRSADLFLRLHCDVGSGRGFTWYYPDRTGHKNGYSGPPANVVRASRSAAWLMNEAMKPVLRGHLRANSIKTDASTYVGGKQGGVLTGSIYSKVPTALLEMCFINQRGDAQFIASGAGQEKMAEALAAGIVRWKQFKSSGK